MELGRHECGSLIHIKQLWHSSVYVSISLEYPLDKDEGFMTWLEAKDQESAAMIQGLFAEYGGSRWLKDRQYLCLV